MITPQFNLEWKEPPSPAGEAYEGILRELKARAGQWARVQKDRKSTASTNNWRKQGCEAKAHRTNPGATPALYDIYVRWPALKAAPRPIAEAIKTGTAITPRPGGYLASRAARDVPEGGSSITKLGIK